MKRLNKILSAVQKFTSRDVIYRHINGIMFDRKRQVIEATDGQGGIIIKGDESFIVSMANEYAEYLGLAPVGSDFELIRLAPKNGKKHPNAEKICGDDARRGDLLRVLKFGDHDPESCNKAIVDKIQLPRLNQFCKAVNAQLHLIPGAKPMFAMLQYGKGRHVGMDFIYCIAQMPCNMERWDEDGNMLTEKVTYKSLDEIDKEAMNQFKRMVK